MRSYIFILVGIFLVGVLSGTPLVSTTAPGSSANVNFSLGGCSTSAGESIVRDGCSMDGDYFCSFNADTDIFLLEDTRVIGNACSFGGSVEDLEGPGCCPSGMLCITQDNDEALCKDGNCDDYDGNPSGCADASCFYVGELCVSDFSDLPCRVYLDSGECEGDAYGLGQRGLGTEVCGTNFVKVEQSESDIDNDFAKLVGLFFYIGNAKPNNQNEKQINKKKDAKKVITRKSPGAYIEKEILRIPITKVEDKIELKPMKNILEICKKQ